jgi:hypothetical protein
MSYSFNKREITKPYDMPLSEWNAKTTLVDLKARNELLLAANSHLTDTVCSLNQTNATNLDTIQKQKVEIEEFKKRCNGLKKKVDTLTDSLAQTEAQLEWKTAEEKKFGFTTLGTFVEPSGAWTKYGVWGGKVGQGFGEAEVEKEGVGFGENVGGKRGQGFGEKRVEKVTGKRGEGFGEKVTEEGDEKEAEQKKRRVDGADVPNSFSTSTLRPNSPYHLG